MAIRLIHTSCNIASSGVNSYVVEGNNFSLDLQTYISQPRTTLRNTTVSVPITFTSANTFMGMYMCIARSGILTGTLNITLNVKKNGTSQGTKTFAFTEVCVDAMNFYYFDLASLNITTSSADTWTVEFSYPDSTNYPLICRGSGGASDFFYAVCTNADTNNLANDDSFFVNQGVTFTQEASFIMATNATKRGIFLGRDAEFIVIDTGTPITLTANSRIVMLNAKVKIGTSESPISVAGKFTWDASSMTAGYQLIEGTSYSNGVLTRCEIEFYGAKYLKSRIRLTADTLVGANVFNVDTDVTNDWNAGDTIFVYGKDQNDVETQTFIIDSLTATQITTTTNVVTNKYLSGGAVVNASKYESFGVVLKGTGGGLLSGKADGVYANANEAAIHKLILSGVGMLNVAMHHRSDSTTGAVFSTDSVIVRNMLASYYSFPQIVVTGTQRGSHMVDTHFAYNINVNTESTITLPAITINKLTMKNTYTALYINSNNAVINDIVASHAYTSGTTLSYGVLKLSGAKVTLSNTWLNGSNGSLVLVGAVNFVASNVVSNGGNGYSVGGASTTCIATFNNCDFGKQKAPLQGCVVFNTDSFHQFTFNNCYFNHANVANNIENTYDGSFVRSTTHNNTANDYRSWYKYGNFISTIDTIEAKNNNTTDTLTNTYNLSSGNIATIPVLITVNCQLPDSSYTAVLDVEYDGGTVISDSGSATTNLQELSVAFTPTLSYRQLVVNLKQQSDSVLDIDWSNLTITMRPYGYQETYILKELVRTTDDVIADIIKNSIDLFISEADMAVVSAYTGITINHSTETILISSNHTIYDIYDYCQYDLGQNLSKTKFFSTIDAITYSSTYNITVDNAVLTATGKTLSLPTKTFTTLNGGSTTAKVIDINGALVPVTLTNVAVGSQVYIAKQSDGTVILSQSAASSTISINFLHPGGEDIAITIRVRKGTSSTKYLPYEATGYISATTGFSLAISQIIDNIA